MTLVPDQPSIGSSWGHPLQIRRYRALHHSQLSAVSSQGHPSQSRRYRALHPGQLSTRSSRVLILAPNQHSIGPCEVASLVLSHVPVPISPSVAPVLPLMSSTSVLVPITDKSPPVTSHLCPLPSDPFFYFTENHIGYKSRKACGPTHGIKSPAICLHLGSRR